MNMSSGECLRNQFIGKKADLLRGANIQDEDVHNLISCELCSKSCVIVSGIIKRVEHSVNDDQNADSFHLRLGMMGNPFVYHFDYNLHTTLVYSEDDCVCGRTIENKIIKNGFRIDP
jgi:hypothetical protein